MPILEVEIVTTRGESLKPGLARQLADAVGDVMGSQPGQTWVRLRALPRDQYAENQAALPEEIQPVFVTLLKSRACAPSELRIEVMQLCEAIARVCDRSKENVHILYLPEAAGRMSFGGELVTV